MQKRHYKELNENQDTLWWYKGMQKISKTFLDIYLPKNKNLHILDAGCGTGAALTFLSEYGDTLGVDISEDALFYAKKKGKVQKADVSNLPFKNNSFDLVYSFGILYHKWIQSDSGVLSEYYRVLKPGGILILEEPALDWLSGSEDAISFGKHRYNREELLKKLPKARFSILKLSYVNMILLPLAIVHRLPQILHLPGRKQKGDIFEYPYVINWFFTKVLYLESFLLRYMNFPIGMDVYAVAKKP